MVKIPAHKRRAGPALEEFERTVTPVSRCTLSVTPTRSLHAEGKASRTW